MSFGFSVGDIILVSQLAYKLYCNLTTGRRSAAKDLKELEDVLFGLRCALDHLSKAAESILSTAPDSQDANAVEVRHKLDAMVNSCGATLLELDSVTKKYREAAESAQNDVLGDDAEGVSAVAVSTRPIKKRSLAQFKENVRVNWMKIRWDVERKSLSEFRAKLQSHTDAITIILNTLLWSATHRIEVDGKVNAEKVHKLQDHALQSNTTLLQLVQEIRTLLLPRGDAPSPPAPEAPASMPSTQQPETMHNRRFTLAMTGGRRPHHRFSHSISPHYNSFALMATSPTPDTCIPDISASFGPLPIPLNDSTTDRAADTHRVLTRKPPLELPAAIAELNIKRQSSGSKVFNEYLQKHLLPSPPSKPQFLTLEVPTLLQLRDGLNYIFHPLPGTTARQATLDRDERKKEVLRWTHGLEHLLDCWIAEPISVPLDAKGEKQAKVNEIVELLVDMNGSIERCDSKTRRLFYQSTEQAEIDGVLQKLQTVTKSVRVMKEVEEFEDVRDEWKDSQNGG
ncbi:hypothetical protein EPUS_00015 [Endocarpon pusillum Z07020]|uniref:Fungal N-terminal domain-containing protein n=1 Tax=Endocarpon pusillum (strain Z07020 / HMAS-L-300199) TaxID=1263415 RepID=U1GS77_ENDPU|nr:uncharacterized protein EPUS_00015 [Endocarpon pusillum Z07020]ERF75223.1 hypothetical protein EPUS_00015 [Endocarpon pusillum Z07020]